MPGVKIGNRVVLCLKRILAGVSSWVACGAGIAFLAAMFLGSMTLVRLSESLVHRDGDALPAEKRYVRPVADGLRMSRHGIYGRDLVSCDSCRIEKRRHGPFSFGGSNLLVVENLAVTLLPNGESFPVEDVAQCPSGIAQRIGISKDLLQAHNVPLKFSGVKIRKLGVGRLSPDGKTVTNIFTAKEAETSWRGLELRSCVVMSPDGEAENVGKATLVMKDNDMRLLWGGREMKL